MKFEGKTAKGGEGERNRVEYKEVSGIGKVKMNKGECLVRAKERG